MRFKNPSLSRVINSAAQQFLNTKSLTMWSNLANKFHDLVTTHRKEKSQVVEGKEGKKELST